jgi:hypothetical protein
MFSVENLDGNTPHETSEKQTKLRKLNARNVRMMIIPIVLPRNIFYTSQ